MHVSEDLRIHICKTNFWPMQAQIQGRNKGFEREIAECKEVISKQRNEIEEMGAQIEAYEEELFQLRNHTQRFEPHKVTFASMRKVPAAFFIIYYEMTI